MHTFNSSNFANDILAYWVDRSNTEAKVACKIYKLNDKGGGDNGGMRLL